MDKELAIAQLQSKSMVLGLILTFFLGGFGLFYIGFIWGLIGSITMILLWATVFFGGILSAGILAPFLAFIVGLFHIIGMIIVTVSINNYNKRLLMNAINRS